MRRMLSVPAHPAFADVTLLLIRVVGGLAFMLHGWSKIQNPFGWMGPDAFAPGFLQALAALSEFGGGLAWILGLLTPLASLGIASTMTVAFWLHAVLRGDPFVAKGGGASYELAAGLPVRRSAAARPRPGRLSLDRASSASADNGRRQPRVEPRAPTMSAVAPSARRRGGASHRVTSQHGSRSAQGPRCATERQAEQQRAQRVRVRLLQRSTSGSARDGAGAEAGGPPHGGRPRWPDHSPGHEVLTELLRRRIIAAG